MTDKHSISIIAAREGLGDTDALRASIDAAIRAALEHERVDIPCDVYVLLTDDDGIHQLNKEHRKLDRPTDVLSFPMQELVPGEPIRVSPLEIDPETGLMMLGDMVISLERARAQAAEYGHDLTREACFLAVHAALHLLGYDHELGEAEERAHFSATEEILTGLGIRREAVDPCLNK